ncbi:MAG TPA: hypothetical protein VK993_09120 [Chthoniobacterales bacterium]|nr:hypothetical protein [Chthoniobacterales bacterium]
MKNVRAKHQPKGRGSKPAFVARAEASMQRVARKLRAEHRRLNLPLLVWRNGDGRSAIRRPETLKKSH